MEENRKVEVMENTKSCTGKLTGKPADPLKVKTNLHAGSSSTEKPCAKTGACVSV